MKTAFCSVIFPANLFYFNDFLNALENQTDTHFDLLLFNDDVENLNDLLISTSLKYKIIEVEGSPSEIRAEVFHYLKLSNYDTIVFGDTDDYFSPNRVEDCKNGLEGVDILANDIILVDKYKNEISGPYWANRLELKDTISIESIKNYNFLGLGNSAIKQKVLPNRIHFEPNLIAVDWYFYSVLLKNNWKVGFSFNSFTYYRQHNANIVGRKKLTFEEYKKGLNVKLNHYISLSKDYPDFQELAFKYLTYKESFSESNYQKTIQNNTIKNPFWWEEIQL
jgi:hypothetical protein